MKISTKYIASIVIFSVTIGSIFLFKYNPNITENLYSTGVYPYISKAFRWALGWISFSVGDVFYTVFGVYILYFLWRNFKQIWHSPKDFFAKVSLFLASLFFLFHFLWGFNYYRLPLNQTLQLKTTYTQQELYTITEKFITRSNLIHKKLTKTDTCSVKIPLGIKEIYDLAPNGYTSLSRKFPQLKFELNSLKSSIYSTVLTYMGYSGYLNPFTNEAQVNQLPMGYQIPVTSTHEMAHQLGYAAENEANFIGYLAAWHNENEYYKYGACLFALRYCLAEVYKSDVKKYNEFLAKIRSGILKNYQESNDFWQKYQTPVESLFKVSYDLFLKANNQKQGIRSYNYVTGMIINYELTK